MLSGNTLIKLLDGTIKTIEEMSNNKKEDYFVYSIDENNNVFPDKISSINKSYIYDTFITTLDTGNYIETDPLHLFYTKDNRYVSANLLKKADSIFPMNFQINQEDYNYDREMFYDINDREWKFTHHMVMNYMEPKIDVGGFDVHHIDENHKNNNPTNLIWLDSNKHKAYHDREKMIRYNAERDKNILNDQKREYVLRSAACLIRKYLILDQDLLESNRINGFLKFPINMNLVNKYFESFDEFLNLSYEYESKLSNSDYKLLTRSAEDRKTSKRNAMAKIGRFLLDEGKQITEENYEEKKRFLHSNAQPFSKIEKYFKDFNKFLEYVKNYNHKVVSTQLMKNQEKKAMYYIKLFKANNLCVALNQSNFIIVHN